MENKLEVNPNRENETRNVTPTSTGRNFLIRDRNPAFYPPLERWQNSLGFWYSSFPRFHLEVGLKFKFILTVRSVQNWHLPQLSVTITPELGRMRVYLCFLKRSQNFPIAFTLGISPDSAPYPISGVLQDHRRSKSEAVFKILPLVHCVPTIITSSLFIGFERMSKEWKIQKAVYEFGMASFLRW
jgi:hypothetical protein